MHHARALAAHARRGTGSSAIQPRALRRVARTSHRRARRRPAAARAALRWLRPEAVGAHAFEALQCELGGISGCSATSGASLLVSTTSSCSIPSGSANRSPSSSRSVSVPSEASRPAQKSSASRGARRARRCGGPCRRPARPGMRTGILEERQVGARAGLLVAVEEVVDGRVVLVDRLGDQPQAEDPRVEVDVALGASPVMAVMWWMPSNFISAPQIVASTSLSSRHQARRRRAHPSSLRHGSDRHDPDRRGPRGQVRCQTRLRECDASAAGASRPRFAAGIASWTRPVSDTGVQGVPGEPLSDSLEAEMAAPLPISSRKQIALIAHDNRKADLLDWAPVQPRDARPSTSCPRPGRPER